MLPEPSKSELEEGDLELIKLANKQLEARQFNGTMQIIEKVRGRKGRHSTLYKLASDTCIGLEKFREAEIHGLMAYINGERQLLISKLGESCRYAQRSTNGKSLLNEAKKD